MPKAKVARKSTSIDMTPMVDLAFLLITFFMLTVKFRPEEAVEVVMPSSIATTPLPAQNILQIQISKDGRAFVGVSDQATRDGMLEKVAKKKGLEFTEPEKALFRAMEQVPVRIENLKEYLNKRPEDQRKILKATQGVPYDSTDNQLDLWVLNARLTNPGLRIAIKADQDTPYPAVRQIVNTLKKQRANRFNLITTQEADPRRVAAEEAARAAAAH